MDNERDWRELADELLSAVPVDIHDSNAWVREACDVMNKALATHDARKGGGVSVKTASDYEQDEDGHLDTYCQGHMDGWNAALRAAGCGVDNGPMCDILDEVRRATAKFPTWPTDPLHAVGVVNEEVGELSKAVLQQVYEPHKNKPDDVRTEAIQAAAMLVRFIASLEVYKFIPGEQHSQNDRAIGDDHAN